MNEDTQLLLRQLQNAYRDMPYNQRRLGRRDEAQWLNQQAVEIAHAAFSEDTGSDRAQVCSTKGEK